MLNTVLTVRGRGALAQEPRMGEVHGRSHSARERESDASGLRFVGRARAKKTVLIDTQRHVIVKAAHPSPLSASKGFFGSRPFSAINQALAKTGQPIIDWQLPNLDSP